MESLNERARDGFVEKMVLHCQDFSPRLSAVLGEDQLRTAVRQAIGKAREYEFTFRGPVRLFVDLVLLFGSDFGDDPVFTPFTEVLLDDGNQMFRAERLHEGVVRYIESVHGPDNVNVHRALSYLGAFASETSAMSRQNMHQGIVAELEAAFPQRVTAVGKAVVQQLVSDAEVQSAQYDFPPVRGTQLMAILNFAFGHGFREDPLYPWIGSTLRDERIIDGSARAQRLEKKALTWLDHVQDPEGMRTKA